MNSSGEPLSPSTAAEIAIANRKFAKTCVEKKRRDRINKCLDELKEIMSQADDKARYQKMEKAEILEMAVNYMRMSMSSSKFGQTPSADIYAVAYNHLLADFTHSLAMMPGLRDDFKMQLMNNLGAQILRSKATSQPVPAPQPPPPPSTQAQPASLTSHSQTRQVHKRRRDGSSVPGKKFCVESMSQQYFMYSSKFGGSSSSLDTNVHVPVSPCGSSSSFGDSQALNLSSSSSNSSPPISACSSPNSSKSTDSNSQFETKSYTKIFRPYL